MKIFKQSGPAAQIVVFLAILIFGCLCAIGVLITVASFKGMLTLPGIHGTATRTAAVLATQTSTPFSELVATLTPLPGQWTATSTLFPERVTNTPNRTPSLWTVAPTVQLVPPSITPLLEFAIEGTPTPETDQNLRLIQLKSIAYQAAYRSFVEFHQQLVADPALVVDEKWKTNTVGALSRLEDAAGQFAAVKLPDPIYAVYASYLDQLYAETGFMATAYRKGLDRFDSASLHVAEIHLQAMNDVFGKADQEFKAVKSRLATPAFTPGPSWTPGP